jgi:FeS assembly SUF system protein
MGIFSFLTSNKAADSAAREADRAGASIAAPSVADGRTAAARSQPASAEPYAASETPFRPPDAWNVDALLAPRPFTDDKPEIGPVDAGRTAALQPKIVEVLKTVYDPEIPVDIYELGLIYGIDVDAQGHVLVRMTLTSPACPSAQQLPSEVRYKVKAVPGVSDATVDIVWEPPCDKDRMSEAAKLQLGFF